MEVITINGQRIVVDISPEACEVFADFKPHHGDILLDPDKKRAKVIGVADSISVYAPISFNVLYLMYEGNDKVSHWLSRNLSQIGFKLLERQNS
jgi:hypothetical protein